MQRKAVTSLRFVTAVQGASRTPACASSSHAEARAHSLTLQTMRLCREPLNWETFHSIVFLPSSPAVRANNHRPIITMAMPRQAMAEPNGQSRLKPNCC